MYILYAYFIAMGVEHFKMQSAHDTERECIIAKVQLMQKMPELNLECILVI